MYVVVRQLIDAIVVIKESIKRIVEVVSITHRVSVFIIQSVILDLTHQRSAVHGSYSLITFDEGESRYMYVGNFIARSGACSTVEIYTRGGHIFIGQQVIGNLTKKRIFYRSAIERLWRLICGKSVEVEEYVSQSLTFLGGFRDTVLCYVHT